MANIQNELNNIKNAIYGKDVRSSIHDGIDAINNEVENTTGRQADLENIFDQLIINAGNSNAEIVDARIKSDGTSYSKLGDRLNEVDLQLAHIENDIGEVFNGEIPVLKDIKIYSNIKKDKTNTNTNSLFDNVDISYLNLSTQNTVLNDVKGCDINLDNNNFESTNMCILIDKSDIQNINITNNDIVGGNFPVLLNSNAKNTENININFNNIKSLTGGDCIEINSPSPNDDSVRNVKIIGNTLYSSQQDSSSHNAGFGVALAQARDVIVIGNVSEQTPQEGLHIEDGSENISVVGNVFNNCINDGCWILSDFYGNENNINKKPYLIIGNHFKKKDNSKTGVGIKYVASSSEDYASDDVFSCNRVEGFEYGLETATSNQFLTVDNLIINNCKFGIVGAGCINGSIIMHDTDYLIKSTGTLNMQSNIISKSVVNIDNAFSGRFSNNGIIDYKVNSGVILKDSVNPSKVKLLKIKNTYFNGYITILSTQISTNYNINISNSILTGGENVGKIYTTNYGNLKLTIEGNYLYLNIYNPHSDIDNIEFNVVLNGLYSQE